MRARLRRVTWAPYLCLLPATALMMAFVLYPVATVFYFSLQRYDLTQPSLNAFVGLDNFVEILTADPLFIQSVATSARWVVTQVALQLLIGMALALILDRTFRLRGVARVIIFSPWALSGVVVTVSWALMYQPTTGALNVILQDLNLISSPIQWLADTRLTFWSVAIAEVWRGVPFFTILLLAGLQSISPDLYEAAAVDGANAWQQFRRITLPLLRNIIVLATLLRSVWEFNNVDVIYTMTGGGPANLTTTLPLYVVRQAISLHNFGYGAALSVIGFVILSVMALAYLRLGRFGEDS